MAIPNPAIARDMALAHQPQPVFATLASRVTLAMSANADSMVTVAGNSHGRVSTATATAGARPAARCAFVCPTGRVPRVTSAQTTSSGTIAINFVMTW